MSSKDTEIFDPQTGEVRDQETGLRPQAEPPNSWNARVAEALAYCMPDAWALKTGENGMEIVTANLGHSVLRGANDVAGKARLFGRREDIQLMANAPALLRQGQTEIVALMNERASTGKRIRELADYITSLLQDEANASHVERLPVERVRGQLLKLAGEGGA